MNLYPSSTCGDRDVRKVVGNAGRDVVSMSASIIAPSHGRNRAAVMIALCDRRALARPHMSPCYCKQSLHMKSRVKPKARTSAIGTFLANWPVDVPDFRSDQKTGEVMIRVKRILLAATFASAALATPALANVPAVTVSGSASSLTNPPFTLGYAFQTSQSFNVTGLGIFDDLSDGLFDAHDVGLWDASGTLLASTTVGAGTAGTLLNGFRFASITPISVIAGTYRVGAVFTSGNDKLFFPGNGTVTAASGVTYLGGAYANGSTLADPTTLTGATPSFIGGNVLLSAVPEPATWAMLVAGFGIIGAAVRRRQTSKLKVTYA